MLLLHTGQGFHKVKCPRASSTLQTVTFSVSDILVEHCFTEWFTITQNEACAVKAPGSTRQAVQKKDRCVDVILSRLVWQDADQHYTKLTRGIQEPGSM